MPEPYRVRRAGDIGFIAPNDVRPPEQPPQAWSSVSRVRMANGSVFSVPGYARTNEVTDPTDLTVNALDYYNGPIKHKIAYADANIYTINAAGVRNTVKTLTGDAGTYPDQIWVTDQFNSIPIATNNRAPPQCQYAGGGLITETTPFVPFPDWDTGGTYAGAQCLLVVAYGNFIVALNIVDVDAFPNLVAWSDLAEPGLMPASWDYNDPATLAGRRVIGADDGPILCAKVQRGNLMIYCEWGTHRLTFVPGSEFVMDNDRVFDNFGAFGPRSVGSYGAKHLVVTKDDVIQHDGQNFVSVAIERVRDRVFDTLTQDDVNRVFVEPYLRNSEMWIGLPNEEDKFFNVLTWRWAEQKLPWSVRDLVDSRHVRELPILEVSAIDDSWEGGNDDSWDGGDNNIWDFGVSPIDLRMEGSSTDGWIYSLDDAPQTQVCRVQRTGINLFLDKTLETITEFIPRIESQGPVDIRLGAQKTPESPVKWSTVATFDPSVDYHVTRLVTGRWHAIEISGLNFRLNGYEIHWEFAGED